jgi:hypothetical protein
MLLLPEGQMGKAWVHSKKCSFGNWGALDRKVRYSVHFESCSSHLHFLANYASVCSALNTLQGVGCCNTQVQMYKHSEKCKMLWQEVVMAWFQTHHFPGEMENLTNLSVDWQSPSWDWNYGSHDDKAAWLWHSMGTVNHPFYWITTNVLMAVNSYTGEDNLNVEWISDTHSSSVFCWLTGHSTVLLDMFQHCGVLHDCMEQSPAGHVPTVVGWPPAWRRVVLVMFQYCGVLNDCMEQSPTGHVPTVVCWPPAWRRVLLYMFQYCGVLNDYMEQNPAGHVSA